MVPVWMNCSMQDGILLLAQMHLWELLLVNKIYFYITTCWEKYYGLQ